MVNDSGTTLARSAPNWSVHEDADQPSNDSQSVIKWIPFVPLLGLIMFSGVCFIGWAVLIPPEEPPVFPVQYNVTHAVEQSTPHAFLTTELRDETVPLDS